MYQCLCRFGVFFFFQAEDGIRDLVRSRGLGDVYKRQDIHSCTDITGFGFLGHALETVAASDVGLHIDSSSLPVIEGVRELAGAVYVPGGLYRNRSHFIDRIEKTASCPEWILDVCFDPQTAGGLFFSLPAQKAQATVEAMHKAGISDAAVVGETVSGYPGKILIT